MRKNREVGLVLLHFNISLLRPRVRVLFTVLAVQNSPTVLIQLDRGNYNVAGVDANGYRSTVRLVALDTVDMDHPFFAVHLGNLALTSLVLATDDPDFIILSDRKGAAVVLAAEFLRETRRHDLASDGRGCGEVGLAGLPS